MKPRWRHARVAALACLLALACPDRATWGADEATAATPIGYKAEAGPHEVAVVLCDWQDARRRRSVPAKIYCPAEGGGPSPVVIVSHGAGGSREGYEYLGRHWASHGYVSVHLQHIGSDEATWRGRPDPLSGVRESVADPRSALERPRDVSFAIDQLGELNSSDRVLKGQLDLDRVGLAGHSFGAWTALAVAGETFVLPGGREVDFRDERVLAAVAMSAPVPRRREQAARAFGSIRIPCLHMTGTLDDSIIGDTKAAERRIPYDAIREADQYLVTFIGGDHMVFSGRGRLRAARNDELFQGFVRQGTTAFWDAYLRGDERAKAWLTEGGYAAVLGDAATYECTSP